MSIGIDLMGGDFPPLRLTSFLEDLAKTSLGSFSLKLFITEEFLSEIEELKVRFAHRFSITPVLAKSYISMDEDPLVVIRKKEISSLHLGLHDLKEGKIDALITLGNTGALLALAKRHISAFEGISRPALLVSLPTNQDSIAVLDVGATVSCTQRFLMQCALLGCAFQQAAGITKPKLGLLNIGIEEKKGRPELREVYKILQSYKSPHFDFAGNIEANEVFKGYCNVLVTDGFTGNIFLKTCEGISGLVLHQAEEALMPAQQDSLFALKQLKKVIYFNEYPGAILCGLNKLIFKCHGNSSSRALFHATCQALDYVKNQSLIQIKKHYGMLGRVVKCND